MRRSCPRSDRRRDHRALRVLLAALLGFAPGAPASRAQEVESPEEWSLRRRLELKQGFGALEAVVAGIPGDTYNGHAVVAQVGRDPRALFEWVRDETRFVPYRGSLRGPVGVLMDRLGNSVDRALLLAELLRRAGHEARLARAALDDERVREIAARLPPPPPPRSVGPDAAPDPDALLDRLCVQYGLDRERILDERRENARAAEALAAGVEERVREQSAFLFERCARLLSGDEEATARALADRDAALADHWWVQVREGDGWLDLDPLLPDAAAGAALAAARESVSADSGDSIRLAAEQCHEVVVRVVAERFAAGTTSRAVALERVLRPAELFTTPVVLVHDALDLAEPPDPFVAAEPLAAVADAARRSAEWLPMLRVGAEVLYDQAFDAFGDLRPVQLSPEGRVARAQQKGLDALTRALGGVAGEEAEGDSRLSAVFLEWEIRAPGRDPRVVSRPLFDLLGPAARRRGGGELPAEADQRLRRGLGLAGEVAMLFPVARFSQPFLAHLSVDTVLRNRDVFLGLLQPDVLRDPSLIRTRLGAFLPSHHARLLLLAQARHDIGAHAAATYLDEINVLAYHTGAALDGDGAVMAVEAFDLVHHPVAVLWTSPLAAPLVRVEQGAVDAALEAFLLPGPDNGVSVTELLARSAEQDVAWSVLQGEAVAAERALANLEADAAARIAADLAAGCIVVAPESPVEMGGRPRVGWWRIDPATGVTQAMMASGRGDGLLEYAKLIRPNFGFFAGVVSGWLGCAGTDPTQNSATKNVGCVFCALAAGLCLHFAWAGRGVTSSRIFNPQCGFWSSLGTGVGCATATNL